MDSKDRCPTKFYAMSREPCIRREFDEILQARFEAEFKRRLFDRAGRLNFAVLKYIVSAAIKCCALR
nr:hypothetical protein [uncultured Campylobacter sp.]